MLKNLLPWALIALLVGVALYADSCRSRAYDQRLATVKAQADSGAVDAAQTRAVAALLRDEARRDSLRLVGALARNDTLAGRLTTALGHIPPPILLTPPDTCLPWVQRGHSLEAALGVAREQIANFPTVVTAAEDQARHLQAAADTLDMGLGRAQARFDTIRITVPTKAPTTTTSLWAEARYEIAQGWPHAAAGVQVKSLFAGVDAQPVSGAIQLRGVVGLRKSLRLW